jgi:hypothetical protein
LRLQPGGWQDRKVPDHTPMPPSEPSSDQLATQQQLRAEAHASLEAVAGDWQRLADATGAAPFFRPGWFAAWWEAFGTGRPEVVASAAPTTPWRPGSALRRRLGRGSCPAPTGTARCAACSRPIGGATALTATLFERGPFEMSLGFVDGAAPELDLYRAAAGHRMLERTMQRSPYVITTGTWTTSPASG